METACTRADSEDLVGVTNPDEIKASQGRNNCYYLCYVVANMLVPGNNFSGVKEWSEESSSANYLETAFGSPLSHYWSFHFYCLKSEGDISRSLGK